MMEHILKIFFVALLVFFINIPFGKLRGKSKKFSFIWFLYIHLPVPVIVLLRHVTDLGSAFYTYPILIVAFFLGQRCGNKCSLRFFV